MSFLSGIVQAIKGSTALRLGLGALGVGAGIYVATQGVKSTTEIDIGGTKVNVIGIAVIGAIGIGILMLILKLKGK